MFKFKAIHFASTVDVVDSTPCTVSEIKYT